MRCLLVDDEPGIREGLATLLRRQGHDVHTAGDCEGAIAAIAASAFDVVITDWRLPDGVATRFLADCPCPVVAVSGHPEEVRRHAAVREVLTKPVAPARLFAALAAVLAPAPLGPCPPPLDVQAVIDAVRRHLPDDAVVETLDDGAFLVVQADLDDENAIAGLATLGGDLRILSKQGRLRLDLRLCRDGRPDPSVPVVAPERPWPEAGEFAIDFDGTSLSPAQFAACLDRARRRRDIGHRVHFLNVPEPLRTSLSDQGRAHDMPMREKVGPRLPAVFADLWS